MIIFKINERRIELGLSISEMGRRAGFSRQTASKYCHHEKIGVFTVQSLDRLCRVLHCQPGDIIEYCYPDYFAPEE